MHVGTLHRFKDLEYQRVILAGICDGAIPRRQVADIRVNTIAAAAADIPIAVFVNATAPSRRR